MGDQAGGRPPRRGLRATAGRRPGRRWLRRGCPGRAPREFNVDAETYLDALRDWAEHGAESRWALGHDEVVEASRPRPREHAEAAAAFEIGQHLHRNGHADDAGAWFKRAHELHPENWTYKRQAWTFVTTPDGQPSDLIQAGNDVYGTSWLEEVRRLGPETYYEPFDA